MRLWRSWVENGFRWVIPWSLTMEGQEGFVMRDRPKATKSNSPFSRPLINWLRPVTSASFPDLIEEVKSLFRVRKSVLFDLFGRRMGPCLPTQI